MLTVLEKRFANELPCRNGHPETRGQAVFVAAAGAIKGAIDETYKAGAVCPSDFGGKSSTLEFAREVSSAIRGGEKRAGGFTD